MILEIYDDLGGFSEAEEIAKLLPPRTRAIVKSSERKAPLCRCGSCVVCEFRAARALKAHREGRIR